MRQPYLLDLTARLRDGLTGGTLSADRCAVHTAFVRGRQQPDGGFAGREDGSDLYYTGFAVRALALLDGLTDDVSGPAADYLRRAAGAVANPVDLASWLFSALTVTAAGGPDVLADVDGGWAGRIGGFCEAFRADDGGYCKASGGAAGSTYTTFLVVQVYDLLGTDVPDADRAAAFLRGMQRDDGGFVEIAPARQSGTNPTAAAVAALRHFGGLTDDISDGVREYLAEAFAADEGGFRANLRIPFADGLSTFTGLLTAADVGAAELFDGGRLRAFAAALADDAGGYRGAAWDQGRDVEYTLYGLGVAALAGAD